MLASLWFFTVSLDKRSACSLRRLFNIVICCSKEEFWFFSGLMNWLFFPWFLLMLLWFILEMAKFRLCSSIMLFDCLFSLIRTLFYCLSFCISPWSWVASEWWRCACWVRRGSLKANSFLRKAFSVVISYSCCWRGAVIRSAICLSELSSCKLCFLSNSVCIFSMSLLYSSHLILKLSIISSSTFCFSFETSIYFYL